MTDNRPPPPRRQLSQRLMELPADILAATEVTYRSFGLGAWGTVLRSLGMPLEKIALLVNSSQVSTAGGGAFRQACDIAFKDGWLAPYRVITSRSLVAWSLQYSIMGFSFQVADRALSSMFNVEPCLTGEALLVDGDGRSESSGDALYTTKTAVKLLLAPMIAGSFESVVSNKAEVTRFYGEFVWFFFDLMMMIF